ncbi:radical SAM protein, partial [Phascolarctobacterium faecium]|nr:radical SAM protein [Phascolarctobacterium faecium]
WIADNFEPGQVLISLMHQYIPCGRAAEYPEINPVVTAEEYQKVEQYLYNSGIEHGYVQEDTAPSAQFITII